MNILLFINTHIHRATKYTMTTLRFNNNPDQQILTDLKSLNALGEDNANQLIQIVAEFLINQQASQLLQDVNQFAQTAQAPVQTVKNISRAVLMISSLAHFTALLASIASVLKFIN